jgi:hypothetical protein
MDPRNNHVHALSGDRQGFFHGECWNESGAIPNDRSKNFHGLWRIGDKYSLHVRRYHPMAETWLPFSLGRELYPAAKKPSQRLPESPRYAEHPWVPARSRMVRCGGTRGSLIVARAGLFCGGARL